MTTPRRRILRPNPSPPFDPRQHGRLQRQQTRLVNERRSLDRWMAKLKRAFHIVERQQRSVARLERELARHRDS